MTIVSAGILTPNALSTATFCHSECYLNTSITTNCCLKWYCSRNEFTHKKKKILAFFLFPIYCILTFRFELLTIQLKSHHCDTVRQERYASKAATGWYKQVHITESSKVFMEKINYNFQRHTVSIKLQELFFLL